MNQLLTPLGGMPFELDDLRFMQDAFRDGFKGIIYEFARFNNGNIILGGCNISNGANGTFDVSEGYIMLDYEVLYVPATTGLSFSLVVLEYTSSFDPVGNDVFADNVTRDTYEIRRARAYDPNLGTSPNAKNLTINNNIRIETIIGNRVGEAVAQQDAGGVRYDFVTSDFSNGYTPSTAYPPYAIKKQGRVLLHGVVDPPSGGVSSGQTMFALPTGFTKVTSSRFGNVYVCNYDDVICRIGLDPNNLAFMSLIGTPANTGLGISIAGIAYDVD